MNWIVYCAHYAFYKSNIWMALFKNLLRSKQHMDGFIS
jgi:hypothetical protein